jgi:hypothetical protein
MTGGNVLSIARLDKAEQALPGERQPVFTPSDAVPPAACRQRERLTDAAGAFKGWLSYGSC